MGSSFIGIMYEMMLRLSGVKQVYAGDPIGYLRSAMDRNTPVINGYPHEKIDTADCYWIGKENAGNGVIVYLPGGGWVTGPAYLHWRFAEILSNQSQKAVLVICYPLAPEHPFPEAINAIMAALDHFQRQGLLNNWVLGGDSAGGNLTLAIVFKLQLLGKPLPRKVILLSPVVDLSNDNDDIFNYEEADPIMSVPFLKECRDAYVKEPHLKDPLASPIFADLSGLPPVLLQIGTRDLLVSDARKFAAKMKAVGKNIQYEEYEEMIHAFMIIPLLPEASKAIESIVKFVVRS